MQSTTWEYEHMQVSLFGKFASTKNGSTYRNLCYICMNFRLKFHFMFFLLPMRIHSIIITHSMRLVCLISFVK